MKRVERVKSDAEFKIFLNEKLAEFRKINGVIDNTKKSEFVRELVAVQPGQDEKNDENAASSEDPNQETANNQNESTLNPEQLIELKELMGKAVVKAESVLGQNNRDMETVYKVGAIKRSTNTATNKAPKSKDIKRGLGDGLYINIRSEKLIYFLIAMNLNGKKCFREIGNYDNMKFEDARKQADEYQRLIKTSRRNIKNIKIINEIKSPQKKKKDDADMPCFRSELDLGEFTQKLMQKIEFDKTTDIYLAIALQLLFPTRSEEILAARMADLNRPGYDFWAVNPLTIKNKFDVDNYEHISELARKVLRQSNNASDRQFLFPWASADDHLNRDRLISNALNNIWPEYQISTKKFKLMFEYLSKKHSNFQPTFISNKVKHKGTTAYWRYNQGLSRALTEWWSEQIGRGGHCFRDDSGNGYSNRV